MTEDMQIANAMEGMIVGRTITVNLDGQAAKLTVRADYPYSVSDQDWDRINVAVSRILDYAKEVLED